MIGGNLKPYPAYKESGVPPLGQVPKHWDVRRAKFFLREVDERSVVGDEELLSVSHKTGVTPRREKNVTMFLAESNVGHKVCRPGDVVINTMWAWMAALGVSKHTGIVSPSYGVYRPLQPDRFLWDYLDELLRTPSYRAEYVVRSAGITQSRLRLYADSFLRIPILCPSAEEQTAILRFIRQTDGRIRRYIRAKQKLIKLLEEQKQLIVRNAVARGIDSDAQFRPSGVEWLGDIPKHWEIAHLRYLVRCLDGRRVPLNAVQRETMQGEFPYWGANRVIDHLNDWLFDEPLVLLGEDGAPFFEPGRDVAFAVSGKIWVNNHAHVIRCGQRLEPRFLAHVLNCVDYTGFIQGSTRDKLTQQAMGGIPVQVPPKAEQVAIADHLATATADLRRAIEKARGEVTLLDEYRTRFVADVVTGKTDVREVAGRLLEEPREEASGEESEVPDAEEISGDDLEGLSVEEANR